ncbi:MAG: ATP-binding cassette domain-containing protein [Bacteroidales bacterium]|nr:ATP-binding cassette domain-containing protein [Bacteroidales bacterium]
MGLLIKYTDASIVRQESVILKNVDLEVNKGDFVYAIGKVGSGKSTLLKSIYADIPVEDGTANVLNYDLRNIKRKQIPYLRRKIGIVFQDFQLLIDRSVNDNLEFVLKATGWSKTSEIKDRINSVLAQVGMQTKGYKMPHQLSGGEQQRVVIARALLNSPEIILADEPTGNLDPDTGAMIAGLLYEISKMGTAVIMSTHNHHLTKEFPGRVLLFENQIIEEVKPIIVAQKE